MLSAVLERNLCRQTLKLLVMKLMDRQIKPSSNNCPLKWHTFDSVLTVDQLIVWAQHTKMTKRKQAVMYLTQVTDDIGSLSKELHHICAK